MELLHYYEAKPVPEKYGGAFLFICSYLRYLLVLPRKGMPTLDRENFSGDGWQRRGGEVVVCSGLCQKLVEDGKGLLHRRHLLVEQQVGLASDFLAYQFVACRQQAAQGQVGGLHRLVYFGQ